MVCSWEAASFPQAPIPVDADGVLLDSDLLLQREPGRLKFSLPLLGLLKLGSVSEKSYLVSLPCYLKLQIFHNWKFGSFFNP